MEASIATVSMDANNRLPDGGRLLPHLTQRQYDILAFIYRYSLAQRIYPTAVEVGKQFGITAQAARSAYEGLIKKGYAYRHAPATNRSLRLTEAAVEKLKRETEGQASLPGM